MSQNPPQNVSSSNYITCNKCADLGKWENKWTSPKMSLLGTGISCSDFDTQIFAYRHFYFNMRSRGFKLIILRFTKGSFSMLFSLTLFLYRVILCYTGRPFNHWGRLHNRRREYKVLSHSFPLPIQNIPNILCNCKWKIGKVILVKRFTDLLTLAKLKIKKKWRCTAKALWSCFLLIFVHPKLFFLLLLSKVCYIIHKWVLLI